MVNYKNDVLYLLCPTHINLSLSDNQVTPKYTVKIGYFPLQTSKVDTFLSGTELQARKTFRKPNFMVIGHAGIISFCRRSSWAFWLPNVLSFSSQKCFSHLPNCWSFFFVPTRSKTTIIKSLFPQDPTSSWETVLIEFASLIKRRPLPPFHIILLWKMGRFFGFFPIFLVFLLVQFSIGYPDMESQMMMHPKTDYIHFTGQLTCKHLQTPTIQALVLWEHNRWVTF